MKEYEDTMKGHSMILKPVGDTYELVYKDNGLSVIESDPRACTKCGRKSGYREPDLCLSKLPGVKNACCGHGDIKNAYIEFDNGIVVRGFEIQIIKWDKKDNMWVKTDYFPYPEKFFLSTKRAAG